MRKNIACLVLLVGASVTQMFAATTPMIAKSFCFGGSVCESNPRTSVVSCS